MRMFVFVLLLTASYRLQASCIEPQCTWFMFYGPPSIVLHAIHVSVSEINYSEKDKALQITSRIFIDDLELAIRARLNNPELDILHPDKGQTTDQLVSAYLADHLKFKLDNKLVKIRYIAHEIEDVAIICYIEIEGVKKFKTLEILNNVIQEIHNDQSNLVHITYKGPVKSYRLMKDKPSDIFKVETK